MTKTRVAIPKAISEQVLKEFNHRCARCAADRPQIHHIDEDPSNNDPMNLIPLCPNCHLTDQHDPTRHIDPNILKLFRKFRDPTILKSQFQPLFNRVCFLDTTEDNPEMAELEGHIDELTYFVRELEMGSFYAKQINGLIKMPAIGFGFSFDDPTAMARYNAATRKHAQKHRAELRKVRDRVYELVIELLRFQKW